MHDYSPYCIRMLPAYVRRVTTDESKTLRKMYGSLQWADEKSEKYIGI
ncbi:MAG: hypothetical protein NVS4B12_26550 [Ktedonobacteraceae bacterium]